MFELALHVQQDVLAAAQPGEVSDAYELNNAEAQLMAACELIADTGVADFRLACCGARLWPVDVRTDLPVFLEQLQGLLQALESRASVFQLQMYEQGIETVLAFSRREDILHLRCEPLLPGGENRLGEHGEQLSVRALVGSLNEMLAAFLLCCERVCPQLLTHKELHDWRKNVGSSMARLLEKG
jgi:hypothetical protein